ncbi:Biopolymer transporter ExbD [uncultured Desulfovibrio sp.]|uniref:Biopolymer transporter ExbD n=2 Tax=Desulfovibrio TaxID=872 RepID=A0A212L0N5_9BACT|nr:Biopolymer transporter ExbD [uncultured Desulfovibrio sp.]VZH32725.1 Biopolymer transporter ExbD [Desulfovibrio sp. 86]
MLRLTRPLNTACDYDLIPLIDMLFILLIFFVIAAAFAVRGLEVDLPTAHSSKTLSGRVIELRLTADGGILCEGAPLPRQEVRDKLHDLVLGFRSRPGRLVLVADPKAPVEGLIFLVDEVRMQGGEKLLIATSGQPATDAP